MTIANEQSWINDKSDRAKWPSGPWDGEPDKVQWKDEATGLVCLANRHPRSGNWCGYVGVPPGHRLHGVGYEDVRITPPEGTEDNWPDVHGGLTFSDKCSESDAPCRGICHIPAPGDPDDVWWLGFDCAHSGDASPDDYRREQEANGAYPWGVGDKTYKSLGYVKAECRSLAAQIAR